MHQTINQLKIATVIVTFNRYAELAKTLKAVEQQGIKLADTIVINNNSSDETSVILQSDFKGVRVITLPDNIASAGGFAKGMSIAHEEGYDWVWLFNDDSRPITGTLQSIMPFLRNAPGYPMGLLKVANSNAQGMATILYWNGSRKPILVPESNFPIESDLVTFDGCLVSKELMDRIGYCDPAYFMGTYEFDYCLKAKAAGYKIYTLPNGLIDDGKLGSVNGAPPWRQYYNTRNHLWLAINRRSLYILKGWLIKELKYTYGIIRYGNNKAQSLLFKFRAIRDALSNRRGKTYDPEVYRDRAIDQ